MISAEAGEVDGLAEVYAVHLHHHTHLLEAAAHALSDAVSEGFLAGGAAQFLDVAVEGGGVGVVGGDDGGAAVVVAGVEDVGDGVPDPLAGF